MEAMVIALLGAAPAAAAEVVATVDVDLAATVHDVEVVRTAQGPLLAVLGPNRTWLLTATDGQVESTWATGGDALVAGGAGELWTCGPRGLVRSSWQSGNWVHDEPVSEPCRDLATLPPLDGAHRLVVAGDALRIRTMPAAGEPTERSLELPVEGWPVLAVDGRRFAAVVEGQASLLEEGPWGTSAMSTGGPVGGLTVGPSSWVWSLPDEAVLVDVTRRRVSVAPGPGALATGDLDGDGVPEVLVAHPDHGMIGVVQGGSRTEVSWPAPTGVRRLAAADVDDDGCDEVVAVTAAGRVQVWDRPCGVDPVLAVLPNSAREVPASTSTASERRPLGVGDEVRPEVRVRVGERVDLQLVDQSGQATAFAASGGPSALVVTSGGTVLYRARPTDVGRWKVSVRLWDDGSWSRRGAFDLIVEGTPAAGSTDFRVSSTTADLTVALAEEVGVVRRPLPIRGCLFGFGGVLGGSYGESWATLGDGFRLSGSPALAFACDGGGRDDSRLWWFAGMDLAPFFIYVVEQDEFRHGLSATIGGGYHHETVFAGAYVTAGATLLGAGPVVRWLPLQAPNGRRQGLETRLTWMPAKALVTEFVLLYTMQIGAYGKHQPGSVEP